ncbi:spermidine synthase [Caldanaerobacter sp.]|uniref:spermine/spermidine synthase domain-containing protein n=1 Tax=Caldanaerobacter sp. TaxID=2930036 RepID=UPI003C75C65C
MRNLNRKWGLDPSREFYWEPDISGGYRVYKVKSVVVEHQSPYQKIDIVELETWGKSLFLDGTLQSTEADEFIYHELLVHPIMRVHPSPRRVLICGVGEGKSVREVLRYPTVKKVIAVDIDKQVVILSQKYLGRTPIDDIRVKLVYQDVAEFIKDYKGEPFDVVIVDVTDDLDGPARSVHQLSFYKRLYEILSDKATVVVQGTSAFSMFKNPGFLYIYRLLKEVFPFVISYADYIPSFSDLWIFFVGLKGIKDLTPRQHIPPDLKYYDEYTNERIFTLAKPLREKLGV